ncbi:uncharacterized protein RJT21DRAFT_89880 [Scheffersomyces amazonensis]|uniref:uncharacterized protein n=1 Tax=Scheffersomyces amazonensis TaxID=1078765 RepID=UPI00315DF742
MRSVSTPSPIGRSPSVPSSSSSLNLLHNHHNQYQQYQYNNTNNPDSDKLIKALLKQFKKLENELNKFNSKKYNHSTASPSLKGNILRTSLLPFLRSNNNLDIYFPRNSQIYKSLNTVITSILIKWWYSLIGNLNTTSKSTNNNSNNNSNSQPSNNSQSSSTSSIDPYPVLYSSIPASDRNAYLECISRILSRDEWNFSDSDIYKEYENLLVITLDYCIDRMTNLKTLSLSVSAFIGKIFAFSFFKLPNVSTALLFLLNVKQITFENTSHLLGVKHDSHTMEQLYNIFPKHLHYLINFQGINTLTTKGQKFFMNCTPPPKHPVNGIKEPNGNWVRRWCSCDSNVFNSFFRHYISILQIEIDKSSSIHQDLSYQVLLYCPGFNIIMSHVFHLFQMGITRISNNNSNFNNSSKFQVQASISSSSSSSSSSSNGPPPPPPSGTIPMKQTDVYYNSIIKIFKTLRDVTYTSKSDDLITIGLIKYFDKVLVTIAQETTIYDCNKNGLILTIVYEFINHITNNTDKIQLDGTNNGNIDILNFKRLIDWEFWLSCNYMMIENTDHIQVLLKNMSFLFNIWDMIPESLSKFAFEDGTIGNRPNHYNWLTELNESFKYNFMNYLISNKNFIRFITHWNPIIRSYYLRLLTWRIIGINNYQSSIMIQTTKRVQKKLTRCYEILHQFTINYQNIDSDKLKFELNYKSDNPLVNRKFGILPINGKNDYYLSIQDEITPSTPIMNSMNSDIMTATPFKSSELRKTHAYEVLDEAIYTCSTLTDDITNDKSKSKSKSKSSTSLSASSSSTSISSLKSSTKNNSLVSSIGKLFKILSIDENEQSKSNSNVKNKQEENGNGNGNGEPPVTRNSASLTSLSTSFSSLKSRSSSPSLMSFVSTPTSITDSTSSSIKDFDNESISSSIQTLDIQSKASSKSSKSTFYNTQPPELSRMPPEIVRPIYKFDIIVDHDSMNEKFNFIHNQYNSNGNGNGNGRLHTGGRISYFPLCPRIPLISIFMNNDNYGSKFFINDEEELFIENLVGGNNETDNNKWNFIEQEQEQEFDELFNYFQYSDNSKFIKLVNLGKSLNELNLLIEEFKLFLNKRIEIDQFNQDISTINEFIYFKKIIPFLSVDSSNELKLLNAS